MRCKPCLAQSLLRMRCIVEMTVEAMPWQYFLFFFGAKQKAPPGRGGPAGHGSSWCSVFSEPESTQAPPARRPERRPARDSDQA